MKHVDDEALKGEKWLRRKKLSVDSDREPVEGVCGSVCCLVIRLHQ